jgi:C-terminal processing protease CtpA/Prc
MSSVRVFVVRVERHPRSGLGLGVRAEAGAVTVVRLVPLGLADRCGRLRVGDRLLSVNGEPLIGVEQSAAVCMLRTPPGHVMLAVARPTKRVCLRRTVGVRYGFRLRVGVKQAVHVHTIEPNSLAAASCLQAGDRLDVINGTCCAGMSLSEAIDRSNTDELVLLVGSSSI